MKINKYVFAALLWPAVLFSSAATADPCGTELCLSDYEASLSLQQCESHVDEFFSIIKYKKDKFSPSKTLKARRDYLNRCKSGNTTDKERILAKYGAILKP